MSGLDANTKLLIHADGQDGGKEIIDSGATGHIVTQVNDAALSTAAKKWGSTGLTLDGDGDYLTIPTSTDFNILDTAKTNVTMECWAKWNGTGLGYLAERSDGSRTHMTWYLYDSSGTQKVAFQGYQSGNVYNLDTGDQNFDFTQWHHYAFIKVGSVSGLYVDGVQYAYVSDSTDVADITAVLYIGSSSTPSSYFNGYIDEFRIQESNVYSANPNSTPDDTITVPTSAHTSDANTKLLLHMDTHDVSGDGGSGTYHIPTFVGTAQIDTDVKKWGTGSLQFFWVKHTDHAGTEFYICQVEDASNRWQLFHVHGSGLRFTALTTGSVTVQTPFGGEITDTDWHHIALIKVGSAYAIYKDGSQVSYLSDGSSDTYAGSLYLGAYFTPSLYLNGYMDEIRIQNDNIFNVTVAASDPSGDWMDNTGSNLGTITVPTGAYSYDAPSGLYIPRVMVI